MTDPQPPPSPPTAPAALTAQHLLHAVVPVTGADPRVPLQANLARIDTLLVLTDAWKSRLPFLPPPPQQQSLQELVQAARRRLRDDHVRTDTEELGARRFVVQRVIQELTP
jgi:hypothetical protein